MSDATKQYMDEWGKYHFVPNIIYERGLYLSVEARTTYIILHGFRNSHSGLCFPSYESLKERTGLSSSAIAKALDELEKFGWLDKSKQFGRSTRYWLKYPERISPTKEEKQSLKRYWREVRKQKRGYTVKFSKPSKR